MKRSLAAVAAAAALALSGCGSGTDTATDPTTTAAQSSSTTTATPTADGAQAGDTVDFAAIAAESTAAVQAKKTAHMTMDLGSQGLIEADMNYASTPPSMKMAMDMGGESMDLIYVDAVMYMGGEMFAQLSGGKKWIKIDPKGTDPMSKQLAPMLDQMESSMANPVEAIAALEDVQATIKSSDASSTTYAVTLTKAQVEEIAKATGSAPGVSGDAMDSLPDEITYDYTIGSDKLPQKVVMELSGQEVEINFSQWGEPVDIAAPPASEVGTFDMPTS